VNTTAINIVSFGGPNAPAHAKKPAPEVKPTAPEKQPAAISPVEEITQQPKVAVPFLRLVGQTV